jgi:hypothetical protein
MIINMTAHFETEGARNLEQTVEHMNIALMVVSWLAFVVYSVALVAVFL